MREIISPIGNPDRKWAPIDSFHLSLRGRGDKTNLLSTRTKDKFWVGTVEVFYLDDKSGKFNDAHIMFCHVFKIFGKEAGMQNWGFLDEIESNGGRTAVFSAGKWFLQEEGEALEFTSKQLVAPFKEIVVALHTKEGVTSQVFKR